jgi:hypothetical protein
MAIMKASITFSTGTVPIEPTSALKADTIYEAKPNRVQRCKGQVQVQNDVKKHQHNEHTRPLKLKF